ncbi:hypothetical protein BGZ47_001964, partial [Haplosporangium gracile]
DSKGYELAQDCEISRWCFGWTGCGVGCGCYRGSYWIWSRRNRGRKCCCWHYVLLWWRSYGWFTLCNRAVYWSCWGLDFCVSWCLHRRCLGGSLAKRYSYSCTL